MLGRTLTILAIKRLSSLSKRTLRLGSEHDRAGSQKSKKKGPTFAAPATGCCSAPWELAAQTHEPIAAGRNGLLTFGREGTPSRDGNLEILYWKHVKERLAAQRRLQKRMQSLLLDPAHEQLPLEEGEEPDPPEEEREEGILDNVVGDEGEDDFVEHDDIPPLEAEAPECMTGLNEVPDCLSYEELVRKNVELFIAHSQAYARETMLSRRVRDWEEKMGPQLEEQEAQGAFDIHRYGDCLTSRLGRVGEWRSFASLVAGEPAFEVCRSLLASLQLVSINGESRPAKLSSHMGCSEPFSL
uniref:Uncharacterized protein n=1 Tax=Sphaerodactylus townsendi TaxID=933632 RepID=A0ACB8FLS8_9SAUR